MKLFVSVLIPRYPPQPTDDFSLIVLNTVVHHRQVGWFDPLLQSILGCRSPLPWTGPTEGFEAG